MSPARNLVLVLVVLLSGCVVGGRSVETEHSASLSKNQRAAEILARKSDASSLAAAALLRASDDIQQAAGLSARAFAAAPGRPDLAWLHTRLCVQAKGCDPSETEVALRRLAPENGGGWIGALEAAARSGDKVGVEQALQEIARRREVDLYWNPVIGHLSTAMADARALPLDQALLTTIGLASGYLLPSFTYLTDPCKAEALEREGRRATCRAVAAALQRGDTYIGEGIGAVLVARTWPADSPEALAAVETRRVFRYRTSVVAELERDNGSGERWAREYVQILAKNPSEQASMSAQIVAAGREPNPPAGWANATP